MRSKTRFRALRGGPAVALMAMAIGVAVGTAGAATPHQQKAHAAAQQPLVMAPTVATSITDDFNPYSATGPLSNGELGAVSLVYEPLLQFDIVKGTVTPWLASAYNWSHGGREISFTIRQGVKWSDGKAMTAADVAYSYEITKANPAINIEGLTIDKIITRGHTVSLTFPTSEYQQLQDIASVYIVPEHIWAKAGDPSTYTDPTPVGTGPYIVKTYTAQGLTFTKNPHYWQKGLPKVDTVEMPVYTSNQSLENALVAGQVDWASVFIPGVQKLYESVNPDYHYYGPALRAVALFPNLKTWPTNQLAVRQAISYAENRTTWASEAESGLAMPLKSATGLPPVFGQYISSQLTKDDLPLTPNDAKAEQILQSAGWTKGSDGYFQKNGKELAITIIAPSAFSDWSEEGGLLQTDLRSAGINATFEGQSVTGWRADMASGDFQLSPYWETLALGVNPDKLITQSLDSHLTAAVGSTATGDFVRLEDPAVDALISKYETRDTLPAEVASLTPVEKFVMNQLPIIPSVVDDAFTEYSTKNFTGFPSASNPYAVGSAYLISNEVVLLHLTPR